MVLALTIYPSLAHDHELAVWRHLNARIVRQADYIVYIKGTLGAGRRFAHAQLLAVCRSNADLEILISFLF